MSIVFTPLFCNISRIIATDLHIVIIYQLSDYFGWCYYFNIASKGVTTMTKEQYIEAIILLLQKTNDEVLLDFILKLLEKAA